MKFIILSLIGLFLLISCQTPSEVFYFKKLRLGMEKGEIVELLGVPVRKERKSQRDWWYYTFYEEGLRFDRMVVFENGKVIYAGRVTKKKGNQSAIEEDELNQKTNELKPVSP
jgi:outer membrane protein assembly factor BamE (lipoprotein component of BamABCDE complex)